MGAKKKCVAVTWFFSDQTGLLVYSYRLRELAKRFDLTIVYREDGRQAELDVPGAHSHIVPSPGVGTASLFRYQRAASRYIAEQAPDLVVALGAQLVFLSRMCRDTPVAVYWNEHPSHIFSFEGAGVLARLRRRMFRLFAYRCAKNAACVMPIGEVLVDDLIRHRVNKGNLRLVYMGVDDAFAGAARRSDAAVVGGVVRLIYTGTVSAVRGRDVMLEGMALAVRQGLPVRLLMVGAAPEELDFCLTRIRELGLDGHVEVMGRVNGKHVPELLCRGDVGICLWADLPQWQFNPPTKLFEYFVAGLPVLASRGTVHERYVRHGDNGWLFDYSAEGFAAGVAAVVAARQELPAVCQRAAAAGAKHLWSDVASDFNAALDSALAR